MSGNDVKIRFSRGNLQYNAALDIWRFAANQYDVIGVDNQKSSNTYEGWIDLFGWGTSGYSDKYPYFVSQDLADYSDIVDVNLDISKTNYDWAYFNKISNGEDSVKVWRILSKEEWRLLFEKYYYTIATVCGVRGVILSERDDIQDVVFFAKDFKENDFDAVLWSDLERDGCVFFPFAGYRIGRVYYKDMNRLRIWTSTSIDDAFAYVWGNENNHYYDIQESTIEEYLYVGLSVRPVVVY
jgi:hypothetical protein